MISVNDKNVAHFMISGLSVVLHTNGSNLFTVEYLNYVTQIPECNLLPHKNRINEDLIIPIPLCDSIVLYIRDV